MTSYPVPTIKNTPFNASTLDWSRLACQSVNTVLRSVDEMNQEGGQVEFSVHRLKEDGFVFLLSDKTDRTRRVFLLKLADVEDKLSLTLLELDPKGESVPMTPLRQQLSNKVSKLMRTDLHSEYIALKSSFAQATPLVPPSLLLH